MHSLLSVKGQHLLLWNETKKNNCVKLIAYQQGYKLDYLYTYCKRGNLSCQYCKPIKLIKKIVLFNLKERIDPEIYSYQKTISKDQPLFLHFGFFSDKGKRYANRRSVV